jgi:hypothetical protein
MEPVESLRVFPDNKWPEGAWNESQLIGHLVERSKSQWEGLLPRDGKGFEKYKSAMEPAWRHTLQVEFPERSLGIETSETKKVGDLTRHAVFIGRKGAGDRLPVVMFTPAKDNLRVITVLAHPDGKAAFMDEMGAPRGLAKELLSRNHSVILLDTFLTGELADRAAADKRKYTSGYFTTYNRTDLQERVQDLITACAFAQIHGKGRRVVLSGSGRAGLWALLASPAADAVIADCSQLDLSDDAELMKQDLFAPGLRKIGAFEGAALLAGPNSLLVHNTGEKFSGDRLAKAYDSKSAFRREVRALDASAQAEWIAQLKLR